jgi:hypothetical protein
MSEGVDKINRFLSTLGYEPLHLSGPQNYFSAVKSAGLELGINVFDFTPSALVMVDCNLGALPGTGVAALMRRLLGYNGGSGAGVFFGIVESQPPTVNLRTSRLADSLDLAQFKQMVDLVVAEAYQQGGPIQQEFGVGAPSITH